MTSTISPPDARSDSRGSQKPRIHSFPPHVSSSGREAIELGEAAGVYLDEWQQLVLLDSLGETPEGKWAAFEVGVNVARQNGKNEIALVRELAGLFLFGEHLLIHSAHEFKTSTEHQRRIEEVVQDNPEFHKRVKPRGYRHSHGEESIELRTGQRIRFMTRTKGGGRGHTGDLVVFDEAMILAAAMLGALMPTLSARSILGNPQLWYFFTAVDRLIQEHGVVAAKLRERGLLGDDPSLAYFEWSIDAENPDRVTLEMLADRVLWGQANPAMGIRISEEHIANELRSMDPRTFAVERLGAGDYPAADGTAGVIPVETWNGLIDGQSRPENPVSFAFDVSPDRSSGSIAVAGRRNDGLWHLELVDNRRGTGWIVDRLAELTGAHENAGVVYDGYGPAGSLANELVEKGVSAETVSAKEHSQACGLLFDAVVDSTCRHRGQTELLDAIRGAAKRPLGDAWAWSRKTSATDISPLVATTLALWRATVAIPDSPEPWAAFV